MNTQKAFVIATAVMVPYDTVGQSGSPNLTPVD